MESAGGHRRTSHTKPRVHATGPNQVWTWDISRLAGPRLRSWFYLYIVIDIYSRCIVGWAVADVESDKVARRMIRAACGRHGVDPDTLTLHSDRGAQMTSNSMAELLEELGVTRSLSRPRASNDCEDPWMLGEAPGKLLARAGPGGLAVVTTDFASMG